MLLAALLLAQAAPTCAAIDANLPAPLAAWTSEGLGDPGDLTRPLLLMSRTPQDQARLDATPPQSVSSPAELVAAINAEPATPAQTGGVASISFRIGKAGIYGIALDQPGWIAVAPKGGGALTSTSHSHGPACSTIAKIVRFDLQPGLYELRLTKLTKPAVKVLLVAGE